MSSVVLQNLKRDSDERTITDRQLSVLWILLPLLSLLVVIASLALALGAVASSFSSISSGYSLSNSSSLISNSSFPAASLGISTVLLLIPALLFLYFYYLLIRRRNLHFQRQQRLMSDLVPAMRLAASKKNTNIDAFVGSIDSTARRAQLEETEKSAVVWVVLLIIPLLNIIAGLYILYFLTTDYYKHERMEDNILSDLDRAFSAMGMQFVYHRTDPIPHRSFVLYLILSIITLGLFALYWEYCLIKDPNNHFVNHAMFEPAIIQLLTPVVS